MVSFFFFLSIFFLLFYLVVLRWGKRTVSPAAVINLRINAIPMAKHLHSLNTATSFVILSGLQHQTGNLTFRDPITASSLYPSLYTHIHTHTWRTRTHVDEDTWTEASIISIGIRHRSERRQRLPSLWGSFKKKKKKFILQETIRVYGVEKRTLV